MSGDDGEPLPFGSIYVKNSSYGVASNLKGLYLLDLKPGTHTLIYSYTGFENQERTITLKKNETILLDVVLKTSFSALQEIEVVANKRDKGREIMEHAIDKRRSFLNQYENYTCETYILTTLDKETLKKGIDSILAPIDSLFLDTLYKKKEKLNLIESISQTYFKAPNHYKEIISGYHDYAEKFKNEGSITIDLGQDNYVPNSGEPSNPYVFYNDVSSLTLNFYETYLEMENIASKPILSPLAASAFLNYKFLYNYSFVEDNKKIYKIEVVPLFKNDALFRGFIFIEDSSWAIKSVDLSINKNVLTYAKEVQIIQNYSSEKGIYFPVRRELIYTIRDGGSLILGNTRVSHSHYEFNIPIRNNFFNNQIKTYQTDAFDQPLVFWENTRPVTLLPKELKYIEKSDSIKNYHESVAYLKEQDSINNHLNFWDYILSGITHQNSFTKTKIYFTPLIAQVQPLGVGGYRHNLGINYQKEFPNAKLLETDASINYGFINKDIKGEIGVGLTYFPKKFIKTYISFSDNYELINNYESIFATFSRSNYVRKKTYLIYQRMEIINGFFGKLSFQFSDRESIANLTLEDWSNQVFGALNIPVDFPQYKLSELTLQLTYFPKQKYLIKKNKKVIIGTKYPEFNFKYRKGIPNLLGSEVDFDYIEFGAKQNLTLARMGDFDWEIKSGAFINKHDLRFIEHKFFRGSDKFFFSSPLRSFQLLEKTLNTSGAFLQLNGIHHFNGFLLNKIPLISRLKLGEVVGAGVLYIQEINFKHFEMFVGLDKIIKIRKQLFKIGVFGVTSDNSLSNINLTLKVGFAFYNSYTKRWSY